MKKVIHLATDVESFFEDEVKNAARKQGVDLSPFASRYVGRVLTRFTETRAYLTKTEDEGGKFSYPTLALLWLEGFSKTMNEQLHQFQHVGDLALFTSGFFGERLGRSMIDMDYYVAMGGKAYERAGQIRESIQAERDLNIFFELSGTFGKLVDVVAEISDRSLTSNDRDLLRLYEKWVSTGSERIRRMLAENGVIPGQDPGKAGGSAPPIVGGDS